MNKKLLFMLNCLPTIIAAYMYECVYMVRLFGDATSRPEI